MTNHGLNQSVYPLPIDDLQNMAKLTQQILPGGEEMAVGTGSQKSHTLKWRTTEKRGSYSPYVCIHMYIYIHMHVYIYKICFPKNCGHVHQVYESPEKQLPVIVAGNHLRVLQDFLLLRYDVGKTIINHPPNHPNHHFYRLYKPFPVMGGLSLFYPHYTRIMFHFHDRNAILDPASQICGSPSLNGYTCLVG